MLPFTIKRASEILGCPAHTIRYYEKEGLLPNIKRDNAGNRLFEEKDLEWINLMTCFRATGMKVADLKKIVDLALQGEETIPQRQALLESHLLEIKKRQLELKKAYEAVNFKLDKYERIKSGQLKPEREFQMERNNIDSEKLN